MMRFQARKHHVPAVKAPFAYDCRQCNIKPMHLYRNRIFWLLLLAAIFGVVFWRSYIIIDRYFLRQAAAMESSTLRLVVSGLNGELKRFEPVPMLLAGKNNIKHLLSTPHDKEFVQQINRELEAIALSIGASDIYVMDKEGNTIAASNYNKSVSFIGQNFNYRPYFTDALEGKPARYFALGTTSLKRGYYFSAPVRVNGSVNGVVAVKIGVGAFEKNWRGSQAEFIVSDAMGIVFMTSRSDWLFGSLRPLSESALDAIRQSRRYPIDKLKQLKTDRSQTTKSTDITVMTIDNSSEVKGYLVSEMAMPEAGWTLQVLVPRASVTGRTLSAMIILLMAVLLIVIGAVLVWQRRTQLIRNIEARKQAQDELEHRVALRTRDLDEANRNLRKEVEERAQAEEKLRSTQQELIQAGKLAALGQMSAALSHELNQPLAAIKSYADNARAFLNRGNVEQASDNIGRISEMTDRMAELGSHLKNFARRPRQKVDRVRLGDVTKAVREIMAGRLRNTAAELHISPFDEDIMIVGGLIRLQQVLVNLLNNALDAMEQTPQKRIEIDIREQEGVVCIDIRDSGPGLSEDIIHQVFDPFFTTKDVNEGLGLGLSISYNIIRDFGGTVSAANHPEGGAVFAIALPLAEAIEGAAQ